MSRLRRFVILSLYSVVGFAAPSAVWNFANMRNYVASTDFFKSKPCIVYRDIWDPKVKAKAKTKLAVADVQEPKDIEEITFHHAESFEGLGAMEIKNYHVNEKHWSDIAYHYVIVRKTPPETFFIRVMLRKIVLNLKAKGFSKEDIAKTVQSHWRTYQERRAQFESAKASALADPRNEGCQLGGDQWMIYEGRAEKYQGAHAGLALLRYDAKTRLFVAVTGSKGNTRPLRFTPDGKIFERNLVWGGVDDVMEYLGLIKGAQYKINVADKSLELVGDRGEELLHPVTGNVQRISLLSRAQEFKLKNGKFGVFKDGELVKLNYNYGSIGVVIAGTYSPYSEDEPFGYPPGAGEALRQPDKEAVSLLGQVVYSLRVKYPSARQFSAHRSGPLPLTEKRNCTGGDCPGEGALEVLRAFNERYFKEE